MDWWFLYDQILVLNTISYKNYTDKVDSLDQFKLKSITARLRLLSLNEHPSGFYTNFGLSDEGKDTIANKFITFSK